MRRSAGVNGLLIGSCALLLLLPTCESERRGGPPHVEDDCGGCEDDQLCDHVDGRAVCVNGCSADPDSCPRGEYCRVEWSGQRYCTAGSKPNEGEGEEGEGEEGEGEEGEGEEGEGTGPEDCGDIPMTQGLSEPCCIAFGIDACGAGLFCAAFDGRRQATCYAERSRADHTECSASLQCQSGDCNVEQRACRSIPGALCTPDIGCANDQAGRRHACDTRDGDLCRRIGDGSPGAVCAVAGDCTLRVCEESHCLSGLGQACRESEDCRTGSCQDCDYGMVFCARDGALDTGSECLKECRASDGGSTWYYYAVECNRT